MFTNISLSNNLMFQAEAASETGSLTAILAWKSAVGTMGMGPPCFPNFRSKLSCTDTSRGRERR